MLCQKCHKNLATTRYAEVVDGKVTDLHLCAQCLARQQAATGTGFRLSGPAPQLHKPPAERVAGEALRRQRACSTCGMRLSELLEEARVGCTACYETFGTEIESMLEGLHLAVHHKGRVPHLDDARSRLRAELQSKRALLRSVLRAEKYEEAALLRDEIRGLESGLQMTESGRAES